MPRALFDQTIVAGSANRKPVGTVVVSIALHAAALVAIVLLQLTGSLQSPEVAPRLLAYTAPLPTPPQPPPPAAPPRPVTTTPEINPNLAPTVSPDAITPEVPQPPGPPDRGVPGGLPGVSAAGSGVPGGVGTGPVTIGPPPAAPPTGPVRAGGDVKPPTRVSYVPPAYPTLALSAKVEGDVTLEATIDETGAVVNVVVRRSVPLLDRAAVDAVSKWRYTPTRLNGQPVSVLLMVTVSFTLRDD